VEETEKDRGGEGIEERIEKGEEGGRDWRRPRRRRGRKEI
jgi:hypothetical protein